MHTVESDITRPDRDTVAAFEDVPSTVAADATGNVGRSLDSGIEPLYDGIELAGTALTVKASPGDNLIVHKAITMARPGDVLVVDADGYLETGHVGELMCTSCQANDLAGLVIDGAVRDSQGITAMEFPVYARGTHPQGPYKQDPGSINVSVSCGGVTVRPGDVMVGDDDGITVVPKADAARVLEEARHKLSAEAEIKEHITEGTYLFEMNNYDQLYDELEIVGPEDSVE